MEQQEQLTVEQREQIRVQAEEFILESMMERGEFAYRDCTCNLTTRMIHGCKCGAEEHNAEVM